VKINTYRPWRTIGSICNVYTSQSGHLRLIAVESLGVFMHFLILLTSLWEGLDLEMVANQSMFTQRGSVRLREEEEVKLFA